MSKMSKGFPAMLAAARSGDREALDTLCSLYYPTVERIAHRGLRSELGSATDNLVALFSTGDIVQDVFRRVLTSLGSFSGTSEGEFVNYIASAVRTRLLDLLRFHHAVRRDRRKTTCVEESTRQKAVSNHTVAQVSADEQVRLYLSVLDGFAPRERALIVRRLDGEATFEELAKELDFPSKDAARKAFNRLHARLLIRLQRVGVTRDEEAV